MILKETDFLIKLIQNLSDDPTVEPNNNDLELVQSKINEVEKNSIEFDTKIRQYEAKKKQRVVTKKKMFFEEEVDEEIIKDSIGIADARTPYIMIIALEQCKDNNNELKLSDLNNGFYDLLKNCDQIHFSGLESATDLLFHVFKTNSKSLSTEYKQNLSIGIKNSYFIGCKYISIWGLYHYFNTIELSIFDLSEEYDVNKA